MSKEKRRKWELREREREEIKENLEKEVNNQKEKI